MNKLSIHAVEIYFLFAQTSYLVVDDVKLTQSVLFNKTRTIILMKLFIGYAKPYCKSIIKRKTVQLV